MVITFDLQGRDRKQLVKAIADITGARPVYKFMPTCAFEIDFFTVTKEGLLEFPDSSDTELVELVLDELAEKGFIMSSALSENGHSEMFEAEELSESEEATDTATPPDTAAVTEDEEVSEKSETTAETATPPDTAAVTEVEEVSEEAETTADTATQPDTAETAESVDRFSISMRRDFFDEALFAKLDRLIESKSDLFKMAFKTDDLSYEVTDDRVTFAWFPWAKIADEGIAYSTFIDLLTKHLKEQKRVNASKTQTDNPKFAMRVFLIRLGMVGETYKTCRKILLRNLEGSSAFRKGAAKSEDTE